MGRINLAIIGLGNMGEAILAGVLKAGSFTATDITGIEARQSRADEIAAKYCIKATTSTLEGLRGADMILLAVKPSDVSHTLTDIATALADGVIKPGATLVSICAGVTFRTLGFSEEGKYLKVVRVMPNTPALIGEAASAYCTGRGVDEATCKDVEALLSSIGKVIRVADEKLMDGVTGLSGSGPAFVFTFLEALADGGVAVGLPRDTARLLAAQTVLGAAKMALESPEHTAELKDRVCSPGGTTITGMRELEKAGFRSAVIEAVVAATNKSRELGSK